MHWMDGQSAPQAILDLLACNCARKSDLPKCDCIANGLKCTDMCRLPDCENKVDGDETTDEYDDNDDELELSIINTMKYSNLYFHLIAMYYVN